MRTKETTARKVFDIIRGDMEYIGITNEELFENIYQAGEAVCLAFLEYHNED